MRRSIRAVMLALGTGILSICGPVANAAPPARVSAAPGPVGEFGLRLVDVPVSEAGDPRALRYVVDYLPTGAVIHRRILIVNGETRKARFTVYADAAHIRGGQFIGYTGSTRNELTNWISVQHRTVTLAARTSVMDTITIRVPRGATRGEHYAVVWVQQTAERRTKGDFGVFEVSRVGVRLYLAVGQGGAPRTSFRITSITGHRSATGQSVIVAHVRNTGERAVDLNGTARLADGPGNTSAGPFPTQRIVTLAPGQSWNMTFAAPRRLPDGSWRATVTLESGLTRVTATAIIQLGPIGTVPADLSATQWVGLGLGGLVLLLVLVLVMGQYAVRQRRRQVLA